MAYISDKLLDCVTWSRRYFLTYVDLLLRACVALPVFERWLRESPREVGIKLTGRVIKWLEYGSRHLFDSEVSILRSQISSCR